MNWNALFDAAGLDAGRFNRSCHVGTERLRRRAEERGKGRCRASGRHASRGRRELSRRPAFFQVVGTVDADVRGRRRTQQGRGLIRFGLFLIVFALLVGTLRGSRATTPQRPWRSPGSDAHLAVRG